MKTGNYRFGGRWKLALPCLLCSALALILGVPEIFARYGSREEGRVGARVASFQVSLGSAQLITPDHEADDPEDQVVYRVRLKNESECRSYYELEIVNDSRHTVAWVIAEPQGILEIGEEKSVDITLQVPESTFSMLTASTELEGIRLEAAFSQAWPGGTP